MDISEKLEEIFRGFPGIGPRQAKRFVYHLLTKNQSEIDDLVKLLGQLKSTVTVCTSCFRFFNQKNQTAPSTLCPICLDPNRDTSKLMIVARDIDLQAIEKSRAYNGTYFILGGTVPILDPNPETKIRQDELLKNIKGKELGEIIIATSINPESEYTATYLTGVLKKEYESSGTKMPRITTLGRGLSTGTELEYSDTETLRSALENRR
jgi:recombination protein RecR